MIIESKTSNLMKEILKCLKPAESITVSEWADKYRKLPAESSSEPGQWQTSKTPYLRKILDDISDNNVRKVVIMASAQIGKSEALLNSIGYFTHIEPSPILMVQPTVDMGKDFSKERISPTIRDTAILKKLIGEEKKKDSKNTILKKYFPGGYIAIVGSNSPVGLAARPVRVLLADEIDRWPESAGKEGDPLTIVEKRTTTYPYNHKKIYTSTPTIDGISRIQHEFMQGSMESWHLPCPGCGDLQKIEWANIIFYKNNEGKFDESKEILHKCNSCGELNNEYSWKSGTGEWVAKNENSVVKSFHLSSLLSPWKTWKDVVLNFLESKDDTEMLKVWTNTELGEVWLEDGESIDTSGLSNRKEHYNATLPNDVLILTIGVDVQDDRFELEVVGWGLDKKSWGIEYVKLYGDTSLTQSWDRLDQHLKKKYAYENGKEIGAVRVCIDSGGHRTTECYKFCKLREHRGIYAIKGKGGSGIHIIHSVSKTKKEKNNLFIIGTDAAKAMVYSRLAVTDEHKPGYCHFPIQETRGYDEKYFDGLTSEVKRIRIFKGRPKTEWVKRPGIANEPLDCRVYATAALEILNPSLEQIKKNRDNKPQTIRRKKGTVSKGVNLYE